MLTKEQLKGMWVSVPTEWDEQGEFDEKTFRGEIAMLIDAGAHGLYTTGSTGEFYALDWEEFQKVTDAFLAETVGKIPVQVGANWFNTRDTIRRVRYARDQGAGAVQICFPGWMIMTNDQYDQFLVDVYEAVPDISLIHYNVVRSGKLFYGKDYARIGPRIPTIIGTKAAIPWEMYPDLVVQSPELCHFVGEMAFPFGHQLGALGMYTSWFMMNPTLFHEYYQNCADGQYAAAFAFAKRLASWWREAVDPLLRKGHQDPVLDKAFVEMAGWLPGNRQTRKPHSPLTDEEFSQLRRATERTIPEFLAYRP